MGDVSHIVDDTQPVLFGLVIAIQEPVVDVNDGQIFQRAKTVIQVSKERYSLKNCISRYEPGGQTKGKKL